MPPNAEQEEHHVQNDQLEESRWNTLTTRQQAQEILDLEKECARMGNKLELIQAEVELRKRDREAIEEMKRGLDEAGARMRKKLELAQAEVELEFLQIFQNHVNRPPRLHYSSTPSIPTSIPTSNAAAEQIEAAKKTLRTLLKLPPSQPSNTTEIIRELKEEKDKAVREVGITMEDWRKKDMEVHELKQREAAWIVKEEAWKQEKQKLQQMVLSFAPHESEEFKAVSKEMRTGEVVNVGKR